MNQSNIPKEILERLVLGRPKETGPKPEIAADENHTVPLALLEIKHPSVDCTDCSVPVVNRQVHIKKYQTPYAHWKRYCTNCQKYQNPITGEYSMEYNEIINHHNHLNRTLKESLKTAKDK